MAAREVPWWKLGALGALLALIAGVALIVRGAQHLPDGVQPIAWHEQPCAHCQMLIGEPRHAAQLISSDGDVLAFDDPGCALRYLDERRPTIHRLWFRHAHQDRWLTADEVAFTTGATTPMASGLLAVEKGAPGAIDLDAARTRTRGTSAASADASPAPHLEAHP